MEQFKISHINLSFWTKTNIIILIPDLKLLTGQESSNLKNYKIYETFQFEWYSEMILTSSISMKISKLRILRFQSLIQMKKHLSNIAEVLGFQNKEQISFLNFCIKLIKVFQIIQYLKIKFSKLYLELSLLSKISLKMNLAPLHPLNFETF